ncbi:alanine--glyoxylate aminotransferase family protein, partial [Candidatus Bathyarchaeota archaeon]|nr:alanine--glyoxylate aminotransferase family protein [Candidatus Bathyarchaeota archaeon]
RKKILMIPGPSETYPEALAVMAEPTKAHYGSEWGEIYRETCNNLKKLFNTNGDAFIITGSGTSAMEMCVAGIVEPGDRILNLTNGFFGERFEEIIISYGGKPITISEDYGKPLSPSLVREALEKEGKVKAVCMVYNETSTGVLNPLKEIAAIMREFEVPLIVDAVSALGGIEVDMDAWGLSLAFASSPKALGAPPVLGLVAISPEAWGIMEKRKKPIQGFYLNPMVWRRYAEKWGSWGHPYPTSTSTPLILGLKKALEIALKEGLENRYRRHETAARAMRSGLRAMGLRLVAEDAFASPTVTSFWIPEGIDDIRLRKSMDKRHGILVGGGLGRLQGKIIRIGHMGLTANAEYILPTLEAIEDALRLQGYKVEESGVSVAKEVFQRSL